MVKLNEGGHAVKNVVRINQENVEKTLKGIQSNILDELGVKMPNTAKTLGSTGKRNEGESSGDIDIAVSMEDIMQKNNLDDEGAVGEFIKEVSKKTTPDVTYNKGTGIVSISYPIKNVDKKQRNSSVQVDFMITPKDNMDIVDFGYHSPHQSESKYKGAYRNIALMSIAGESKYKPMEKTKTESGKEVVTTWQRFILDPKRGLYKATQTLLSPKTGKITKTKKTTDKEIVSSNKEEIIKTLLGKNATIEDANSFETIMDFVNSNEFAHTNKREEILSKIATEIKKQFGEVPEELSGVELDEEVISEAGKTHALQGVTHLEFLEDLVFNQGSDGLEVAIETIENFVDDLEQEGDIDTKTFTSSKIDGAPSLYYGTDPDGKFFVSTKAIFNKGENQKLGYGMRDIQTKWEGEIANILASAYKTLKNTVKKPGLVMNGDLLFSSPSQKKKLEVEGNKVIGLQPNTIMYAIPVDEKSEVYKRVKRANLGIGIHGAFESTFDETGRLVINRLPTETIISEVEGIKNPKVFAIHPFIPRLDLKNSISDNVEDINLIIEETKDTLDDIDEYFNETWVNGSNPILKNIKNRMQSFAKSEALKEDSKTIYNETEIDKFTETFRINLNEYLDTMFAKESEKLKTSVGKNKKIKFLEDIKTWLNDYSDTFEPFIHAYFYMLNIKNLLIESFGTIETQLGKEFLIDKKSDEDKFIATKPEGYVLLNGGNMIKIVDRVEFSKNNVLYSPFHESNGMGVETIGNGKKIKPKKFTDRVEEEILDALESAEMVIDSGFSSEELVEVADKMGSYDAIYVGRFQPPTIAHVQNVVNLSKIFKNVYVLVSDSDNKDQKYLIKNPLSANDRVVAFKSDPKISALNNVKFSGGSTSLVFGIHKEEQEEQARELFDIPEGNTIVIAMGKEDDRYHAVSKRGNLFDVNKNDDKTEDKRVGLYGIDIIPSKTDEKISASTIRDSIMSGKSNVAKKMMAGSNKLKEVTIKKLKDSMSKINERVELGISEEIISDIQTQKGVTQEEAFDLLLDLIK
jgi:hypothetical protein